MQVCLPYNAIDCSKDELSVFLSGPLLGYLLGACRASSVRVSVKVSIDLNYIILGIE